MSNYYKYIDTNYTYIDTQSGVLRNLQGISTADVLLFVESAAVTKRLQELYNKPIKVKSIESLLDIHKYLFQDIYEWAGKTRIVEISKDGKQFFPIIHFDNAFKYINSLITEFNIIPKSNTWELSQKLAEILDHINYLHPFREGNGRTQREFLRVLALEKGLILNLNPPNNKSVYDRYMKGTIDSDLNLLTELISELINSKS